MLRETPSSVPSLLFFPLVPSSPYPSFPMCRFFISSASGKRYFVDVCFFSHLHPETPPPPPPPPPHHPPPPQHPPPPTPPPPTPPPPPKTNEQPPPQPKNPPPPTPPPPPSSLKEDGDDYFPSPIPCKPIVFLSTPLFEFSSFTFLPSFGEVLSPSFCSAGSGCDGSIFPFAHKDATHFFFLSIDHKPRGILFFSLAAPPPSQPNTNRSDFPPTREK